MRRSCRFAVLLIALLTASCGNALDRAQADLCRRVLPALHPDGTNLREIRVTAAPGRPGIRIDYAAGEAGGQARTHAAICGFSEEDRLDLAAVEADGRPLGEARLLYLKRFWLAPLGGAEEAEIPGPPVPELPAPLAYAAQQFVNALVLVAIYGLLATAYSLIYGLVGRINLAFGEMAVLGAYGAIGGVGVGVAFGAGNPLAGLTIAFLVAASVSALWSFLVGRAVIAPLHARYRQGQPILIATAAVALTIQEFLRLFQGVRERFMAPFFNDPIALARAGRFVVTVTPIQLTIAAAALLAALATLWLFARTRFGREWRACADDPVTAALFGVAPDRVLAATFLLAGLNAGLAGWIVAVYYGNVSSAMGTMLGLKALLAAVLGGIGRVEGAFLGGVLIGLVEAVWSAYFDIASRDLVLFSLLIVMFVFRPGGLLGFAHPTPRQV